MAKTPIERRSMASRKGALTIKRMRAAREMLIREKAAREEHPADAERTQLLSVVGGESAD